LVADGISWQRLGSDSLFGFDSFNAWPSRQHWLGIGTHYTCSANCPPDSGDPYLLESPDALHWNLIRPLPNGPGETISGVFETTLGLFGVGAIGDDDQTARPALWRSADGGEWQLISDDPVFDLGACGAAQYGTIQNVYETDSGVIAQGSGDWLSSDGTHWQCIDPLPSTVVPFRGAFAGLDSNDGVYQLWLSADGINWGKTSTIDAQISLDLLPVAEGLVAVPGGDPRLGTYQSVYTSTNGIDWHDAGHPFKPAYVWDVTSDGTRATAVDQSDPAIWLSSPDGADWTRYIVPSREGDGSGVDDLNSVAQLGGTVVVTAYGLGTNNGPALYVAQLP
jgi:hypothetical protein